MFDFFDDLLAILFIIIVALVLFSVCFYLLSSNDTDSLNEKPFVSDMELVCSSEDFDYYRDILTDVMYVCYDKCGGLTIMQDSNGQPVTYEIFSKLLYEQFVNTDGFKKK